MQEASKQWCEVRPGSAWDPDASRASAQLTAYFKLEHARASRRLLCGVAVVAAFVAAAIEAGTRIMSGPVFFVALLSLGTLAVIPMVLEWRAEKHLVALSPRR